MTHISSNRTSARGLRPAQRFSVFVVAVAAAIVALSGSRALQAADASASFRAGAGKAVIELPGELFPFQNEKFTTVHDPLQVKVVLLDNGASRIALVVIDATSLGTDVIDLVRQTVSKSTGVATNNIMVNASHTFSSPHVPPAQQAERAHERELMSAALTSAVQKAAENAAGTLQAARVGFGTGTSSVNVSRDVESKDGWWLGANEHGPSDKSVAVVRIDSEQGQPIAILLNYGAQSSIMNESVGADGGHAVTADLAGAATRYVEQQYGANTVSLFLVGAAGDQSPVLVAHRVTLDRTLNASVVDVGDAGFLLVDLLGERLGAEAVRVSEATHTAALAGPLRIVQDSLTLPELQSNPNPTSRHATRQYQYVEKGPSAMPYWLLQIGDIVGVGVQVELNAKTGMAIKSQSPFKNTMVMNMVNGAAKYLPDAGSFDRFTYEAQGARYAKGSAEKFTATVREQLKRLKSDQPAH